MRTVTGATLAASALRLLGVYAPGETPAATEVTNAVSSLNDLIDDWATQELTIPTATRELFPLAIGQQTYTIGSGGNFDTVRPQAIDAASILINPAASQSVTSIARTGLVATVTKAAHGYVTGANITISGATPSGYNGTQIITVLTSSTFSYPVLSALTTPATGTITMRDAIGQAYEIPMDLLTYEDYIAIATKGLTNPFPTQLYYDLTFALGLGEIFVYPIPTQVNQLVLYCGRILAQMDESTSVILPPAAARALRYNLAKELIPEYGKDENRIQLVLKTALESLGNFKRSNAVPAILSTEGLFSGGTWDYARFLSGP